MTGFERIFHIGIDDVDSPSGGCTTHLALLMLKELMKYGVTLVDYPNLVRLNPGVPWKTRGNGAVALRFTSSMELDKVYEIVRSVFEKYVRDYENPKHQPCLLIMKGDINHRIALFAKKALYDIVPSDLALKALRGTSHILTCFNGNRGIVGALGAIGNTMTSEDYTFELIAYRKIENLGKERCVDKDSVIEMDQKYKGNTILNYDPVEDRVLITPRGPDPVLLGIRGEDPSILVKAYKTVKLCEEADFAGIFRTNQHTDPHIKSVETICEAHPYMCLRLRGTVSTKPFRVVGGHVFFKVCDDNCCIDVGVYEPTKWFRKYAELLIPGDVVEVQGCVRPPSSTHGMTLNLEKLHVIWLKPMIVYENPFCPVCGKRLTSAGKGKGFKCRNCGFKSRDMARKTRIIERGLSEGWYQPPYTAFKHVMKPLERVGREKREFYYRPIETVFVV